MLRRRGAIDSGRGTLHGLRWVTIGWLRAMLGAHVHGHLLHRHRGARPRPRRWLVVSLSDVVVVPLHGALGPLLGPRLR